MKRTVSMLMLIATVLVSAACQVTPEEPAVVKKDTERMVEQAQSGGNVTSAEDLALPDGNYTFSATGAEGRFSVNADAPVIIPGSGVPPMARVTAAGFTQEQVTGIFNYLFPGEKPTYIARDEGAGLLTKSEIESKIVFYKKIIAEDAISDKSIFGTQEEVNAEIEKLKEQLAAAPDTLPDPEIRVSDGTLQPAKGGEYHQNELVWEEDLYGLNCQSPKAHLGISTPVSARNRTEAYLVYGRFDGPPYSDANAVVYDGGGLPEGAAGQLTISLEDAKALCDGFFAAGGITDVALRHAYIVDDERFGDSDGVIAPAKNDAYRLDYSRVVGGDPVYALESSGGGGDDNALPWQYEHIRFYVDNEGINNIRWESPTATGETINGNVNVISFDQASAIFEKMVVHMYEFRAEPDPAHGLADVRVDVNVDRVELALVRIREQNADGRSGIYVPAWVFCGNWMQELQYTGADTRYTYYDGGSPSPFPHKPILIINAIDGSVIDLSKGY